MEKTHITDFEQWSDQNEERVMDEMYELGTYREMDFDLEKEFQVRFERYLAELYC